MGYVTPWKKVEVDVNYPDNFDARLITTQSELKEMIAELRSVDEIGIDTETNSTDWGYGHIVGVCLAVDKDYGWYLPFRHEEYNNNIPLTLLPYQIKHYTYKNFYL